MNTEKVLKFVKWGGIVGAAVLTLASNISGKKLDGIEYTKALDSGKFIENVSKTVK